MEGEIIETLRNRMFRVRLDNGHELLGYTAGRLKRYRIRMLLGDRVRIELSPYDLDRGRIVYRLPKSNAKLKVAVGKTVVYAAPRRRSRSSRTREKRSTAPIAIPSSSSW